jgi:hypothetical protein
MSFIEWLKKYVPERSENKILERAGIDPKNITRWKKGVKPRLMPIIFLSKAISLEYNHDFREVVTTGIKAAARLS